MAHRSQLRFWLPLLLVVTLLALLRAIGGTHPGLHGLALALLLTGTIALSGYLFVVIARPETF